MSTSPQVAGQRVIYVPIEQGSEVTLAVRPFVLFPFSSNPAHGISRLIGLRYRYHVVVLSLADRLQDILYRLALGYLYSPASLTLIRPENARGVLAAGCLLGGMDDLCDYAYDVCRRAINLDTIASWLALVDTIPPDGAETPESPPLPSSIFGCYAQRFRSDVLQYLIVTLPASLDSGDLLAPSRSDPASLPSTPSGRDALLRIFSQTPFDIFKEAVESPAFQIGGPCSPRIRSCNALNSHLCHAGSEKARFQFAKDAIQLRKRGIARNVGAEEAVVLAFCGGVTGGSVVHVTRKVRRKNLWKVNTA